MGKSLGKICGGEAEKKPVMQARGNSSAEFPIDCSKAGVALSWDIGASGRKVDLDLQAVAFDGAGKILDAVYYNNLKALGRGLTHSSDETSGAKDGLDEVIWADFQRLPPSVHLLCFVVAAHSGGHLRDAQNGAIHVLFGSQDNVVGRFELERSEEEVDFVAAMLRTGAGWVFRLVECDAQDGQHFIDILEPTLGDYVRRVIPGAPRRLKAAFAMEKASVVDLPRTQDLGVIYAGLGWDTARGKVDLDVSAVLLNAASVLVDVVFFGNLKSNGLEHSGDNLTGEGSGDDEVITIDLAHVSPQVYQIALVINIYTQGRTFAEVAQPYCRITTASGEELCRYSMSDAGRENGLIIARLFREPGNIRFGFQAIGMPCRGKTWKDSMGMIMQYAHIKPSDLQRMHTTGPMGATTPTRSQAVPAGHPAPFAVSPPPPGQDGACCTIC